jgi:hypothetical protein
MHAIRQKKYDVANMTLQTLINTYPDSDYASKGRRLLKDPRIAKCGQDVTFFGDKCNGTR